MRRTSHRVAMLSVLGLVLIVAVPMAQAQRVDFEKETHFRCYTISNQTPEPANLVTLEDQFLPPTLRSVDEPELFCAPTSKNGLPIEEPEEHLTTYNAPAPLEPNLDVQTEDQFGLRTLRVTGARELYVPTQKLVGDLDFPRKLNHYWCYEAWGPKVGQTVTLGRPVRFRHGARRAAAPVLQPGREALRGRAVPDRGAGGAPHLLRDLRAAAD
jgi:hypothetical protein